MIHYTSPDGLLRLGLLLAGGRQAAHGAERGGAQRPVKIGGIDHIDRKGEGRSVLQVGEAAGRAVGRDEARREIARAALLEHVLQAKPADVGCERRRSEEHTSELQSLMRISYAVFCLKKKKKTQYKATKSP